MRTLGFVMFKFFWCDFPKVIGHEMTWSFKILRKALIIHGIQKNGNYYHARIISDLVSGYEDNSFTLHKKLQETADLVTFTEEILNGKLHFLGSA